MQRPPSTSVGSQNACAASSFPSPVPRAHWQWLQQVASLIPKNTSHPVQVTIRTYCLALCLSLVPSLVPFLTSRSYSKKTSLKRVLARELDFRGFAFSVTLAVGGGSFIRRLWHALDSLDADTSGSGSRTAAVPLKTWISLLRLWLSSVQKTFLSNVISSTAGLLLLQAGRRRSRLRASLVHKEPSASRTLDLTLLLLVRALDAGVQSFVAQRSGSRKESDAEHPGKTSQTDMQRIAASAHREALRKQIDSFLFWACSARIMWCFFYEQQRLPVSYVKWINTLAGLDSRLLETLRAIRTQQWSYRTGLSSPPDLLTAYVRDLGYPAAWGDPAILPAYGGSGADEIWKQLGLTSRSGVGGVPCQVVHGRVGSNFGLEHSCTANATLRGIKAFLEAVAIYLPVQFLPVILSRPRALLDPQRVLESLFSALRSATFLSTFVASYWYSVCLTRSVIFARLFPFISHDFYDGPFGCILAGCLVCGSSIWIENGRRRGEMALYVLPRAVRSCLPDTWVRSGNWGVLMAERLTFVLSLSSLLTAATHHAHVLRGLSRWGLRFILRGPDVVFWRDNALPSEKRKIPNPNPNPVK